MSIHFLFKKKSAHFINRKLKRKKKMSQMLQTSIQKYKTHTETPLANNTFLPNCESR